MALSCRLVRYEGVGDLYALYGVQTLNNMTWCNSCTTGLQEKVHKMISATAV